MNKRILFCLLFCAVFVLKAKTQVYFGAGFAGSMPLGNTTQDLSVGIGPYGEIGYTIKKFEISANIGKIFYASVIPGYSLNSYNAQLSFLPFNKGLDVYGGIGVGYIQERIKIDFVNETLTNGSFYVYPEIGFYKYFGKENHFKLKVFSRFIHAKPENVFQSINLGVGLYYAF